MCNGVPIYVYTLGYLLIFIRTNIYVNFILFFIACASSLFVNPADLLSDVLNYNFRHESKAISQCNAAFCKYYRLHNKL